MKELLLAFYLLHGADTVTTCQNLHRGLVEANPLLPHSCASIAVVSTAETIALGYGLQKLHASHPALARNLTLSLASGKGVVVGWNIQQRRKKD